MGEVVVTSSFLEKEYVSAFTPFPETQTWAPPGLPLGKNQIFPQSQACSQGKRRLLGHYSSAPSERKGDTIVGEKGKRGEREANTPWEPIGKRSLYKQPDLLQLYTMYSF